MYVEQSQAAYQKWNDYPVKSHCSNFNFKSRHKLKRRKTIHNSQVKNIKVNDL
jgi:hypothetical protein